MYNPDYLNWGQQGWICPQCHRTFAPHVSECPYCNTERKTFATTITPFDDAGWWDNYNKRTTGDIDSIINSWKTFTTCVGTDIEITPSGAYIYKGGQPQEVYYQNE